MQIGKWFRAGEWTHVVFGEGYLDRLVVFEIKFLCGLYWNVWNVVEHDRFHTHAFPAVSIGVRGTYDEQVLGDGSHWTDTYKAPWFRFIPRTHNHRMLKSSKDAISITFAGPWDRIWTETFMDGSTRFLTWGRKVLSQRWQNG